MLSIFDAADKFFSKIEGKRVTEAAMEQSKKALRKDLGSLGVALITSIITSLIVSKIFKR